ncbi:MAG: 50S ribosomal protein L11 methyltransferase [Bacteroidales bacterium]|jgi:ribosomal protein L11 methyltransferase|nr:50S ribosomal protein L11 methyltransferase [Bacteroidales bacterium]
MDYYEIYFTSESAVDLTMVNDLLTWKLGEIGFDAFAREPKGLYAYIPVDSYWREAVEQCLSDFPLSGVRFHFTQTLIPDRDWNEVWEKNYFQPVRIGRQCLVRAPFHPAETGFEYEIRIHPKMAFGTGNHETTCLMLCEILKMEMAGSNVLDIGCGTGILAILAALKGASHVTAIDVDEWAYRNALENCALNHTEHIRVIRGNAEQIPQDRLFDCMFANINRNILLNDMPYCLPSLKPGGILLLSGFFKEDMPALEAECTRNGLECLSFSERNRWVAMKTEKRKTSEPSGVFSRYINM